MICAAHEAPLNSSWAFVVFQQTENKNLSSEQSNICIIYFGILNCAVKFWKDITTWMSAYFCTFHSQYHRKQFASLEKQDTLVSHKPWYQAWWGPAHIQVTRYSGLVPVKTDGIPVGLWHLTWVWSVFITARQSSPCTCSPYMRVFVCQYERETANQDFLWSRAPGTRTPGPTHAITKHKPKHRAFNKEVVLF